VPYGLGTEWQPDWIGRYLAVKTDLMVFSAPLVVSWAILDNLSISAGGSYSFANVTITQKSPQYPFAGDAYVELEGDDNASFGYNFGMMWKPVKEVSIGGSFRSEVKYSFDGTATSTGAEQLSAVLPAGDISADLTTPMNIQGGIAIRVIKPLLLSADFQWVGWSSYDKLAVDFKNDAYEDISRPRLYDDSYIIRFGGEYSIDENLSLLGGIYYDKNPVEPPGSFLFIRSQELTVDNSTQIYTTGNSPFNGTYNSQAGLFAASIYYSFN
ncbi:MAG: outer membrane protein transport protein, partial [Ignavibacteriaceae bacterium]